MLLPNGRFVFPFVVVCEIATNKKPEGLIRPQAGLKPLLSAISPNQAQNGRKIISVVPSALSNLSPMLQGSCSISLRKRLLRRRATTPACGLSCLRHYFCTHADNHFFLYSARLFVTLASPSLLPLESTKLKNFVFLFVLSSLIRNFVPRKGGGVVPLAYI